MGNDPTGGASLGSKSPSGGATLGGGNADTRAKDALREKMSSQKAASEPPIKKPSEVTGDPYDDHPGTVYACEGPITRDQSGKALGTVTGVAGLAATEFNLGGAKPVPRVPQPSKTAFGVNGTAAGAAGYAIGQTKWFNCYTNNGYNFFFHPGASQTISEDGDSGGLERE